MLFTFLSVEKEEEYAVEATCDPQSLKYFLFGFFFVVITENVCYPCNKLVENTVCVLFNIVFPTLSTQNTAGTK